MGGGVTETAHLFHKVNRKLNVVVFFLRGWRWIFNIAITRAKIHFLYRRISRSVMARLVFRRLVTPIVRI